MIKRLAVAYLSVIALISVLLAPRALASDTSLRVCVLKDVDTLTLTIKGDYKIFALKTNEPLSKGKNLHSVTVRPTLSGLMVQEEPFNIYGIKIVPKKDASISITERSFRGNIDIIRTEKMKLLVINHIELEDYLKGVLYHEVSHWWPIETLKAQAIAARTYALYQKSISKSNDFDLTSDVYSQVYGGKISERSKTNKAVNLTTGRVLTYKKEIFPAYYHATCAGHTEDATNLWKIDIPPLDGVRCNFCTLSPHYRWRYNISITELEERLRLAGYDIKGLKDIIPDGRTSSGRIKNLRFIADKELVMQAKDFRLIIGPNFIRSTNFNLEIEDGYVSFEGMGWGHGVGMCQWGAFFLGLRRYKAERILSHYYPGAQINKI